MAITNPGQTYTVLVAGTPVLISNPNDNRRHVMMQNNGPGTLWFAWGAAGNEAAVGQTFSLANGGIYESNAYPGGKSFPRLALSAVATGGTCTVAYQED